MEYDKDHSGVIEPGVATLEIILYRIDRSGLTGMLLGLGSGGVSSFAA